MELLHTPIGEERTGTSNRYPALVEGLMTAVGALSC